MAETIFMTQAYYFFTCTLVGICSKNNFFQCYFWKSDFPISLTIKSMQYMALFPSKVCVILLFVL